MLPLNDTGKTRGATGLKQPEPVIHGAKEPITEFMFLNRWKKK